MRYYPINLDVKNRSCLVVGGGGVGERKVRTLLDCGALVTVVTTQATEHLEKLASTGEIELKTRGYEQDDLQGRFLVIGATDNEALNEQISKDANERSLLCNIADRPQACNFVLPAIVRQGDLLIAISTSNKSPAVARRTRKILEKEFGPEYAVLLNLMGAIRQKMLAHGKSPEVHKQLFERPGGSHRRCGPPAPGCLGWRVPVEGPREGGQWRRRAHKDVTPSFSRGRSMSTLFIVTITFYIVSSLGYQGYVLFQKRFVYRVSSILLLVGFLCHTAAIAIQYFETGHVPVQSLPETISTFGWTVVGVFLILQIKFNLMILGALVAPLAAVSVIIALIIPGPPVELDPLFKGVWRTFHMGTLMVGIAAFAIAFLVGILYLIQENAIKDKKRGFFYRRLPSLKLLDSMGYSCLVAGFPMLTFGIITGVIYSQMVRGRFWSWNHKEILAGIAWLVYAVLLHERLTVGWRGRRAAIMTIIGFVILLVTFFLRFLG